MEDNFVVWFTGLPCSGKTTLAKALTYALVEREIDVQWLDGDETRRTFGRGLGYTEQDRNDNIERVIGVTSFLMGQGTNVICSYISPYEEKRQSLCRLVDNVIIVFVDTPLETCMSRDVKGMWGKAQRGEITGFTGYDAPYEHPIDPDIQLDTSELDVTTCLEQILDILEERGLI